MLLLHATPGALIDGPVVEWCRQNLNNLKTADVGQGVHFLQEDNPHRIGSEIAAWYDSISRPGIAVVLTSPAVVLPACPKSGEVAKPLDGSDGPGTESEPAPTDPD